MIKRCRFCFEGQDADHYFCIRRLIIRQTIIGRQVSGAKDKAKNLQKLIIDNEDEQ